MAGFNVLINNKPNSHNWAIPDLVIAFSLPFELTTGFA